MTHFLHSRYAVLVAALMAVAIAFLCNSLAAFPQLPGHDGIIEAWSGPYDLPYQAALAIALAGNIGIALLIAFLNKTFNLLRSMTMLQGTLFLVMQMATPAYLLYANPGIALCLVVVVCMFVMMANYANPDAQRAVFLVFFLLSGCASFDYCFVAYLPVFWLACAQMRIFSLRTVIASLLGIATPWIIMLGFGIVDVSELSMPTLNVFQGYGNMRISYLLPTLIITLLVGISAWMQNFMKVLSYNAQSRAQLGLITVCMWITMLAMAIDFNSVYGYLPLLNCCFALQLGHNFGVLHTQKRSYWAILTIIFLFLAILTWKIIDCVF